MKTPQICLVPKLQGLGGMVSFQAKFIAGLEARQIPYSFDLNNPANTAILVIGGTRQLWPLWRSHQRGVRVVQRLNGMNWMHKVEKTPWRAAFQNDLKNQILAVIRRRIADQIVYQSDFSHDWWEQVYGPLTKPHQVTYNAVDLERYTPEGPEKPPEDRFRILVVEGRLTGSYARGLETVIRLAQTVQQGHHLPVELMVVGDVNPDLHTWAQKLAPALPIIWQGIVPREAIPALDRSAHVLFSSDINAACPNSVIEALACGLPVIAYDTGALAELVQDGAGEVVPWGADYWQLEEPVIPPLAAACAKILTDNAAYRANARRRAKAAFGLEAMVDGYLQALGV